MVKRSTSGLPTSILTLLSISHLSQALKCYTAAYGLIADVGWTLCPGTSTTNGGAESCCLSAEDCGSDGLCRTTDTDGDLSWYEAGCTDSSFDGPCSKNCQSYSTTYIEWLSAEQEWMCCGDGGCNGTTTDTVFSAVAPQDWTPVTGVQSSSPTATSAASPTTKTQTAGPTSIESTALAMSTSVTAVRISRSSTSSQTSQTATKQTSIYFKPSGTKAQATASFSSANGNAVSTSSASTSTSISQSNGDLSTGAKAGIGAAIAVATLAFIAAIVAIIMLRKNRRKRDVTETVYEKRAQTMSTTTVPPTYQEAVEIGETQPAREMPADNVIHEMPGNHNRWSKMR